MRSAIAFAEIIAALIVGILAFGTALGAGLKNDRDTWLVMPMLAVSGICLTILIVCTLALPE